MGNERRGVGADTGAVPYDASERTATSPLRLDEVDAVLAEGPKAFGRDPKGVMHFVRRVKLSFVDYREQLLALQREIEIARMHQGRIGTATTLSPADAFKYLSDEQQEALFATFMRARLEALEDERATLAAERVALRNLLGRLRLALEHRGGLDGELTALVSELERRVAP